MIHSEFTPKTAPLTVSLQGELWPQPTLSQARDINRGGLFVLTDAIPEMFSEVLVSLRLPWGGHMEVATQVVHLTPRRTADVTGTGAGVGLEFVGLDPVQKAVVQRLIDWAGDSACRSRVPARTQKADPGYLNGLQSDVLGAVNGRRSAQEIAEHIKISAHTVKAVLAVLGELDLVSSSLRNVDLARISPRVSARPTCLAPAALDSSRPLTVTLPAAAIDPESDRPTVRASNPNQRTWFDDFLEVGSCAAGDSTPLRHAPVALGAFDALVTW